MTMGAAWPATRSALALLEVRAHPFDPLEPGAFHFCVLNPANPFIAREGSDVLPYRQRLAVGKQGFLQVRRDVMHDAGGYFLLGHKFRRWLFCQTSAFRLRRPRVAYILKHLVRRFHFRVPRVGFPGLTTDESFVSERDSGRLVEVILPKGDTLTEGGKSTS